MLNHIVIMGRLTRDPELRRVGSGIANVSFSVAVDRDYSKNDGGGKEVDFIDCTAWRQTAEFVSKYFTRGSLIVVSGRLRIETWDKQDGTKGRSAKIVAENCYFGGSKRDSENGSAYGGNSYGGNNYAAPAPAYGGYAAPTPAPAAHYPVIPDQSDFAVLEDDDAQLPF